ncbi:hypothetical protein CN311_27960, partial [Mesorhizobium sanjuanii]
MALFSRHSATDSVRRAVIDKEPNSADGPADIISHVRTGSARRANRPILPNRLALLLGATALAGLSPLSSSVVHAQVLINQNGGNGGNGSGYDGDGGNGGAGGNAVHVNNIDQSVPAPALPLVSAYDVTADGGNGGYGGYGFLLLVGNGGEGGNGGAAGSASATNTASLFTDGNFHHGMVATATGGQGGDGGGSGG